jgi:hypothetical protein
VPEESPSWKAKESLIRPGPWGARNDQKDNVKPVASRGAELQSRLIGSFFVINSSTSRMSSLNNELPRSIFRAVQPSDPKMSFAKLRGPRRFPFIRWKLHACSF